MIFTFPRHISYKKLDIYWVERVFYVKSNLLDIRMEKMLYSTFTSY